MACTITRSRVVRGARAAAFSTLVLALAAGCSGAGEGEAGGTEREDDAGSTSQEEQGDTEGTDSDDDAAASDEGGASDAEGSDQAGDGAAAPLPDSADLATEKLPITAEQAIEIGTETVGGGDLVQIEIDHDDADWEWELEIILDGTQHELDIDATTGEVTEHEQDSDDDQDPVVDVTSPMTYDEAIEIALGEEPGRVSGWDLDSDDGQIRYQIDIDRSEGGDVEVNIDVETREVSIDD